MIKNRNQVLTYSLILGIFFIFLDAYEVFEIPLTWLGQVLLFATALTKFKEYKYLFKSGIFLTVFVLLTVPQIYIIYNSIYSEANLIYSALRYFNIASFVIVLAFSINYSRQNIIDREIIMEKLKLFCFFYSLIVIYIFVAQIYDFYEPYRNRANTNPFGDSAQSIFWLSQPHRAMGTFREPSFLITFFYPLVLLVIKSFKKTNVLFCILTGLALGITRSDYVRFFTLIVLVIFIYSYYLEKKVNFNFLLLMISILFFSTFGVLECNLNPDSIQCSEYQEDVENINRSGRLKIQSNTASSVVDIGTERLNVGIYFYDSLRNLKPNGLNNVNQSFQTFESTDISNEMYLTNRTTPQYLLTRFSTQNFGTGNYSVLKYEINVQNVIVFYTQAFGVIFIALLFIFFIDFLLKHKLFLDTLFFLMILFFFAISPIEELNAYYGLIIGLSYSLVIKRKNEKV